MQCTKRAAYAKVSSCLTPSLPWPVKFSGWKMHGHTCKQYIFHSYNIYFQCCVFQWKSFHMTVWKIRQKQFRVSDFALLLVIFKWHHGSEGVNSWKPTFVERILRWEKVLHFYSRYVGNSTTTAQKPETRIFGKIAIHSGCCPLSQPPGTRKALSPQVAALW